MQAFGNGIPSFDVKRGIENKSSIKIKDDGLIIHKNLLIDMSIIQGEGYFKQTGKMFEIFSTYLLTVLNEWSTILADIQLECQ